MVAGNEVGGRLGAALLLGPHNGQMWAYIHSLIACCVAGRLRRVDAATLRNAIGLAFAMPHYPLMPGFMGPDSKVITAAFPAVQGLMALDMAQQGMTGAEDILGNRDGFIRRVGRLGRKSAFAGLGRVWLTRTLCFKLYPGCAYIDTAVDSMKSLAPNAEDVREVEVEAHPFTMAMERESERHRRAGVPDPVTVTFNVKLSLALTLLDGEPTPSALEPAALAERWPQIDALARRIRVRPAVPQLGALRRSAQLLRVGGLETRGFRMEFPAQVRVNLSDGAELMAGVDVPLGGAGRPFQETAALVREKFIRNGGTEETVQSILSLPEAPRGRAAQSVLGKATADLR
jgi:2-methylcitrate dehydratase PrpD